MRNAKAIKIYGIFKPFTNLHGFSADFNWFGDVKSHNVCIYDWKNTDFTAVNFVKFL